MIFVTVGTHEQPFNRLIKEMDRLVYKKKITEDVIIQTGFSTYKPKYCISYKMMSFDEMNAALKKARIVITHGGPSSFIEALQLDKVPIVVPRQEKFHEHVNNHQVEFVKLISEKMNNIIAVYDINDLENAIVNYDQLVKTKKLNTTSNNERFNKNLSKIINDLF